MAGDWMKVEKSTPDKPEIYAMADALSIDPDAVFGKCFRVWSWFDSHTTNGKPNGVCVSKLLVDRLVSVNGFANSMVSVGWLCADGDGVYANNFDIHNGETAKTRAMTAKRVAKHANAKLTLDALPREEKRREEVNTLNTLVVSQLTPCPKQEIILLYAEHLPSLPQPRKFDGTREKHLKARWCWVLKDLESKDKPFDKSAGLDFFARMFAYISRSDFLMGRSGDFSCSLPWIVKDENFTKIIEGNYENKVAA